MNTIIAVDLTTIIPPAIMGIISLIIVAMIDTVDTIPVGITINTVDIAVQLPGTMTAMEIGTVTLTLTVTSPMKLISLLAMLVAIGSAGCHDHHSRGGSYDDYPAGYYGQDRYDDYSSDKYPNGRYDRYGRHDPHGRYDRSGRYYDYNYRYGPYDRDGYWYRDNYRRPLS